MFVTEPHGQRRKTIFRFGFIGSYGQRCNTAVIVCFSNSDGQRYKTIGCCVHIPVANAVKPTCVSHIPMAIPVKPMRVFQRFLWP